MNLVILVLVFAFTNHFLDGQFWNLGPAWVSSLSARDGNGGGSTSPFYDYTGDILYRVFPRLTKCEFQRIGSSGGLSTKE